MKYFYVFIITLIAANFYAFAIDFHFSYVAAVYTYVYTSLSIYFFIRFIKHMENEL